MKRFLVLAAAAALAWSGVSAAPATADDDGDWWCVAVDDIDFGYCQQDPLPDRLPLPEDRPLFDGCESWTQEPKHVADGPAGPIFVGPLPPQSCAVLDPPLVTEALDEAEQCANGVVGEGRGESTGGPLPDVPDVCG